jgi:hypothetical protein
VKRKQLTFKTPEQKEIEKRDKYLTKTYGITTKEYNKLLKDQNGICAICLREPGKTRLAVDHRHIKNYKKLPEEVKQKEVRGLCCFICNRYLIGRIERMYKEPRKALEGLNRYFSKYKFKGE